MEVRDTELYTVTSKGHVNIITPRKWRLTDGKRHPVTIIRPAQNKEVRDEESEDATCTES